MTLVPALESELAGGPTHAYLLIGPSGAGKAAAARAFAAELLADGSPDPDSTRARALADPSPHPDLEWVRPPGNQHLVSEIRERIIAAVPYMPFEGRRRVFVIEGADALAEESQNALLTTLEEPPAYAHLILISADPAAILPTIRSRCRPIAFAAPSEPDLIAALAAEAPTASDAERRAASRLAGGDRHAAAFLLGEQGQRLRAAAESCAQWGQPTPGGQSPRPWLEMIEVASEAAERAGERVSERAGAAAEEAADEKIASRIRREGEEAGKRAVRRERTRLLALGLRIWAARLRDVEAAGAGSGELLGCDRAEEVGACAAAIRPGTALAAAEVVAQAHRRLRVNVSEELALESLAYAVAREVG